MIKRPAHKITENTIMSDLLWSDPYENATEYEESPRGYGFLFGKQHVLDFEQRNNISIIVRGHEMADNGVNFAFDGKLAEIE